MNSIVMKLIIDFWGVRGSLPFSAGPREIQENLFSLLNEVLKEPSRSKGDLSQYIREEGIRRIAGYGTATTCTQVSTSSQTLIIDAGTGLTALGQKLVSDKAKSKNKAKRSVLSLFLSHFHWDHLLGLTSFKPTNDKYTEIHIYTLETNAQQLLERFLSRPWVHQPISEWKAKVVYHTLVPRQAFSLGDLQITPYRLDHPDPCWGFKITNGIKTYSHCSDTESTRSTRETLGPDLPLYQGVDLLYFDGQYDLKQLSERSNWGHSSPQLGLDIALREGVKSVLFSHHDPNSDCKVINNLIQQTHDYLNWRKSEALKSGQSLPEVQWDFAYEGQRIRL